MLSPLTRCWCRHLCMDPAGWFTFLQLVPYLQRQMRSFPHTTSESSTQYLLAHPVNHRCDSLKFTQSGILLLFLSWSLWHLQLHWIHWIRILSKRQALQEFSSTILKISATEYYEDLSKFHHFHVSCAWCGLLLISFFHQMCLVFCIGMNYFKVRLGHCSLLAAVRRHNAWSISQFTDLYFSHIRFPFPMVELQKSKAIRERISLSATQWIMQYSQS